MLRALDYMTYHSKSMIGAKIFSVLGYKSVPEYKLNDIWGFLMETYKVMQVYNMKHETSYVYCQAKLILHGCYRNLDTKWWRCNELIRCL